jgi:hypothetical protein
LPGNEGKCQHHHTTEGRMVVKSALERELSYKKINVGEINFGV